MAGQVGQKLQKMGLGEYARLDNDLKRLRDMSEKHAIEYLLQLMEDPRTGELDKVQRTAKVFVDNCALIGKTDANHKPFYVPCDPMDCPVKEGEQDIFYAKYDDKKMRCVHRDTVPVKDTVEGFKAIADGDLDHVAEQAFYNVGGLDDVEREWAKIQAEG